VRRGDGSIPPLSKRLFFKKRDWEKRIIFRMGTNPRVCFLGGMGRRSLVDFQGRKVGF
jgi:hypothetical protein